MDLSKLTIRFLIPLLFVFLWSTGFVGAKYGLPYAEPFTFLFIRMTIVSSLLFVISFVVRDQWPSTATEFAHVAIVGILIHGVYLGGVFYAISIGVDAGVSALIVSLQPLVTVLLAARFLSESINALKLAGIALGLFGVLLVVFDRGLTLQHTVPIGLAACVISLIGISVGTVYQKRYCGGIALIPGMCIQFTATTLFLLVFAYHSETMVVQWTTEFLFALTWLVLVLSLGAVLLLMHLIRRGNAGQVASLFYLVPAFTAVEAWIMFDETFSAIALVGMACCVAAVAIVARQSASNQSNQ